MQIMQPSQLAALSFKIMHHMPPLLRHALRKATNAGKPAMPAVADFGFSPAIKWPKGKKFCLCVSHDVDSEYGLGQLPQFAEMDRGLGLKSAFYIVPTLRGIAASDNFLHRLLEEGFEIGQHGFRHDLDLAVQGGAGIRNAFAASAGFREKFKVKGFRAVAFQQGNALLEAEKKFFAYDSSFQSKRRARPFAAGCRHAFPFRFSGFSIVPVTLPADGELIALKLSPEEISSYWLETAKILVARGALVSVLTHPEKYFSAGSEMQEAFASFIKRLPLEDAWVATPAEAAGLLGKGI